MRGVVFQLPLGKTSLLLPWKVTGKLDAALQNYDQLIIWETGLSAYQKAPIGCYVRLCSSVGLFNSGMLCLSTVARRSSTLPG